MAADTVTPELDKIKQEPLTADIEPANDPNKIQVDIEQLKKTKVAYLYALLRWTTY